MRLGLDGGGAVRGVVGGGCRSEVSFSTLFE